MEKNIVCSKCKRRFATKQALKQHVSASHMTVRQPRPSVRQPKRKTGGGNAGMRVFSETGTDLLAQLNMRVGRTVAGMVAYNAAFTPRGVAHSRMNQIARLWARWKPAQLQLNVVSAGSALTTGSLIVGWSADPTINVHSGTAAISKLLTMPHVIVRSAQSAVLNIPREMDRKWYHTDGSVDEVAHGAIVAVISSPFGGSNGTFTVNLELKWVLQFEGPDMDDTAEQDHAVYPDSGWSGPFFTTADGDLDKNHLTLKEHSGGVAVPWTGANPAKVYQPLPDFVVKYFDASSTEHEVPYFVRNQGVWPALFCFTTKELALEYIKTADAAHAIAFTKAGPWSTGRPAIMPIALTSVAAGSSAGPSEPQPSTSAESSGVTSDALLKIVRQQQMQIHMLTGRMEEMAAVLQDGYEPSSKN